MDLDAYMRTPRVAGLALSPDGRRLVTSVSTVAPDGNKYVTALWELDPAGDRGPRRLTWSAPGERAPVFVPSGDVLFTSSRKDPEAKPGDDEPERAGLWLLPAAGGEAWLVHDAPASVESVVVARDAGTDLIRP